VNAHATVSTLTNCITAAEQLGEDTGDAPQLPPLVKKTVVGFRIKEFSTDKAYTSQENFKTVDAVGGTLCSTLKMRTTGAMGGLLQLDELLPGPLRRRLAQALKQAGGGRVHGTVK
jgi:hypothetical protein